MNVTDDLRVKRNLTALVEFSRVINSSLDLDFILSNILLTCMGKFLATKGLIALKNDGHFRLKSSKGLSEQVLVQFPETADNESLPGKSLKKFMKDNGLYVLEMIKSSEECVGFLSLGQKLNKVQYTDDDHEFLKTILNISSTAIRNSEMVNELKKVNRMLDSKIHRLNSLFELSKEFGLLSEGVKVARLLVYSVIGQFLVSKFAVVVFEGNEIQLLESKINNEELLLSLKKYDVRKINTPLTREQIKNDFPELNKMQIELIVPMSLQGEIKGLIILGKRINNQDYSGDDIDFAFSVGNLAIIALENRKLFAEALEKQKLEEELEIARDIQRNLLPRSIPLYSNFEIAAVNIPSRQVGGDFYDIISLDDINFCVAIADVVGKGVPAALLMANIQAFLKVICKQGMKLSQATALINDLISENISEGKFITFFWALLNNSSRQLEYVNAGHNPPLLIRNGAIQKLQKGGLILGIFKTVAPYESEIVQLQKDDLLILFTDGISEAKNITDEEFTDKRLEEFVLMIREKPADEILSQIQKEIQSFTFGAVQSDDITLLVLKVK